MLLKTSDAHEFVSVDDLLQNDSLGNTTDSKIEKGVISGRDTESECADETDSYVEKIDDEHESPNVTEGIATPEIDFVSNNDNNFKDKDKPERTKHLQIPSSDTELGSGEKESSSVLKSIKNAAVKGAASTFGAIKGAAKHLVSRVGSHIPFRQAHTELYRKKATIFLPHGQGPKTYSRIIRYRRVDHKLIYDPVITVTITPSLCTCYEDTHLFVRFARS